MRDTCDEIHMKQYKKLGTLFIPLCLELHERYYFNILRMITLFYHLYVYHEIYAMVYNKKESFLNDHIFIQSTMIKWYGDSSWGNV